MNTHRAYMGADTAITGYARDESGKRTLSSFASLSVVLDPYSSGQELGLSITATTPATGNATFTVTKEDADAYLAPGPYRFALLGLEGADYETLYVGLLEVV